MKRKKIFILIAPLLCGIVISLLTYAGTFEPLELKSLDVRFRAFGSSLKSDTNIVITVIDERSLSELKRNRVTWKWPRDLYGALVHYLQNGGAKLVVFDMLFSDPDIDRASTDAEQTDGAFAQAMKQAGNVILAAQLLNQENLLVDDNPLVVKSDINISGKTEGIVAGPFTAVVLPIPLFQQSSLMMAAANYENDQDGVFRRSSLLFDHFSGTYPHLSLATYLALQQVHEIKVTEKGSLMAGDLDIPLNEKGKYLVSWYGKGGPDGAFRYYSISALLASALDEERSRTPLLPSSAFKDKIVFIGSNAPGLFDTKTTPLSGETPFTGVEIHATMLSNFLQKHFLVKAPSYLAHLAIIGCAFLVGLVFFLFTKARWGIIMTVLLAGGWVAVCALVFQSQHMWLDCVAPEFSIVFALTAAALTSYSVEGRARRQLRVMFGRYLSPVVISEVIEKQETIDFGGQEITATVMFSDIKDFTQTSERLSPKELVNFLNSYFAVATQTILRNEGLLDKYLGDAVMAVFGAPMQVENHAYQACQTALDMQKALPEQVAVPHDGLSKIETRIGINTGPMVVGNLGSELRLDYTAIGDSVNLASRLESVNKIFGTSIIVGEQTYALVKDRFVFRPLDTLRVKGKNEAVTIYELLGTKENLSSDVFNLVHAFANARALYRAREFARALMQFESLLHQYPNDKASVVYIDRCRSFLDEPPPPDWSGVYILKEK